MSLENNQPSTRALVLAGGGVRLNYAMENHRVVKGVF